MEGLRRDLKKKVHKSAEGCPKWRDKYPPKRGGNGKKLRTQGHPQSKENITGGSFKKNRRKQCTKSKGGRRNLGGERGKRQTRGLTDLRNKLRETLELKSEKL